MELRSKRNGPITKMRFTTIAMCADHQRERTMDNFLSLEGFDKLCKHLREAGKLEPVRKLTRLIWEKISNDQNDSLVIKLDKIDTADEALPF